VDDFSFRRWLPFQYLQGNTAGASRGNVEAVALVVSSFVTLACDYSVIKVGEKRGPRESLEDKKGHPLRNDEFFECSKQEINVK
jgi:hypothetical protein